MVVMDRQKYIDEAMHQLNDRTHYRLLDSDPADTFSQQIQPTLDDMHAHEVITDKAWIPLSYRLLTCQIQSPAEITQRVYPRASNCEWQRISYREHLSLFVDNFIKLLVSQAPSYIHDTPDFLRKLEAIKNQIPSTAIIGTFDVSTLYTNIPHDEGVLACCEALAESNHTSPPTDDLIALLYYVLTKNNFTFMDDHYLQIFGTSMGTRMAPSFACLFMSRLEQQMLDAFPCRPWIWWR